MRQETAAGAERTKLKRRWYRLTPDRCVVGLLALEGLLLASQWFQWFAFNRYPGYAMVFTVAAVALALALMLVWFFVSAIFRRRFQFSLRSLLLLVVVVAIPCKWMPTEVKCAEQQRAALEPIRQVGGAPNYDAPLWPQWLCDLLGPDLFGNVEQVRFGTEINDAALDQLGELPHLRAVWFEGTLLGDSGDETPEKIGAFRCIGLYWYQNHRRGARTPCTISSTLHADPRPHQRGRRRDGAPESAHSTDVVGPQRHQSGRHRDEAPERIDQTSIPVP